MHAAATGYFCFVTGLVASQACFFLTTVFRVISLLTPQKKKVISPFNFWFFSQPEGMKQSGSGHVCSTVLP